MGPVCAKCGTQNRPGLVNCANCGTPPWGWRLAHSRLGETRRSRQRRPEPRACAARPKFPRCPRNRRWRTRWRLISEPKAPLSRRSSAAPTTSRRLAIRSSARGTTKQPAVSNLADPIDSQLSGGGAAAATAGNTALAPRVAPTPANPPKALYRATGAPAAVGSSTGVKSSWIRVGQTALGGPGKVVLAFGFVETLWGALIIALGVVMAVTKGNNFPIIPSLARGSSSCCWPA